MVRLVYGCFGSGKSSFIAKEIIGALKTINTEKGESKPKFPLLIVPESSLVKSERLIADFAGDIPTEGLEVLSFRRLANRVFREAGGLCYNYISEGGKKIILWRAIRSVNDALVQYKDLSIGDKRVLEVILSVITEFMRAGITPKMLEKASENIGEDKLKLKNKISDISLIFSAYLTLMHEKYDDPEEDLKRLCEKLDEYEFFADKQVFIDSFASLTYLENEVLRRIIRSTDVTISINKNLRDDRDFLQKVERWEKKIYKIANEEGVNIEVICDLTEPLRFKSEALSYLTKNLWRVEKTEGNIAPGFDGIEVIECETPYDEVDAAAKKILCHVQNGGRYSDCVVTCGSTERYSTLCHSIFRQHDIPFFLSEKEPLKNKSLIRFILLALDIKIFYFRLNDILSYIKSGLCGIDELDSYLLEKYVLTWKIEGRRWTAGYTWNMNPDGLSEVLTESGIKILNKVNELKKQVVLPLTAFFEAFNEDSTVKSVSKALYDFLVGLDVPQKLSELSKSAFAEGDFALSQEYKSLWGCVLDALDELVTAAGDMPCNAEQYKTLFLSVLDGKEIGKIPTTVDEVVISDALSLRADKTKMLLVLGVNEGVFPRAISDNGFFTDRDKEELLRLGIELTTDSESLCTDEQYLFAHALSVPSEKLILTYAKKGQSGEDLTESAELKHIYSLFGHSDEYKPPKYAETDIKEKIYGEKAAFVLCAKEKDGAWAAALNKYFSEKEEYRDRLVALETPIYIPNDKISEEISKARAKSLSPTRIEAFVMCPLKNNCNYVIKLAEEKTSEPQPNHTGIIMHKILENFLRKMLSESTDGQLKTDFTEEEIYSEIDNVFEEYYKNTCNSTLKEDNEYRNPELEQLFRKLRKTAFYVIENTISEFKESEFVPLLLEQKIGQAGEESLGTFEIPLNDESSVKIAGTIDRVDVLRKEGDIYFRIIDYKTGGKDFKEKDVEKGINLQMILYLMALWKGDNKKFRQIIGANENDKLHPAGIIYYIAKVESQKSDTLMSREEAVKKIGKTVKNGLILKDENVIKDSDKKTTGFVIKCEDEIELFLTNITQNICMISEDIRSGNASAIPYKEDKHDACRYCKFKPVCRYEEGEGEDEANED